MKFLIPIIAVALLCLTPVYAQERKTLDSYEDEDIILNQGNVRGFVWGLPKEIIREGEEGTFVEESEDGNVLYFVDKIRSMHVSINYEFENNKLNRVRIFSEKGYPFPQHRLDDLMQIKQDLTQRFGEPKDEKMYWKKDRNKNFPGNWGYDILAGDLTIIINWENPETSVRAYLGEGQKPYKPILFVTYEDRQTKLLKSQAKQREAPETAPNGAKDITPVAPLLLP